MLTQEEVGIAFDAQECDHEGRARFKMIKPFPTRCACGTVFGLGEPCAKKTKDFAAPDLVCLDCMFGRTPCPQPR